MEENFLLCVFLVLPVGLLSLIYLFFARFRQHTRKTRYWLRLIAGNTLILLFLCSVVVLGGEVYYRFFYDMTESYGLTKTTDLWWK